ARHQPGPERAHGARNSRAPGTRARCGGADMKAILVLLVLSTSALADSGSASAPGSGSGSAAPAPEFPMPAGVKPTQVCLDEMDKDQGFAEYMIRRAEQKLNEKLNAEAVKGDVCKLIDHKEAA